MNIFDLHCDTATVLFKKGLSFDNPVTHIRENALDGLDLTQCFAVFLNDTKKNCPGMEYVLAVWEKMLPQARACGITPVKTVEGGGVLAAKDDWIDVLASAGCRMVGFTWNGRNPLGCGAACDDTAGLTETGKRAVRELNARRIAVDVSHLSAAGTDDVLRISSAPIAASHSNARALCDHSRNLSDETAREIFRRGGVVGLNLYPPFLGEEAKIDTVLRHAEHFLSLGGENGLCLGGDLDGIERMPAGMSDISSYAELYRRMTDAFGTAQTERIFSENAAAFFARFGEEV